MHGEHTCRPVLVKCPDGSLPIVLFYATPHRVSGRRPPLYHALPLHYRLLHREPVANERAWLGLPGRRAAGDPDQSLCMTADAAERTSRSEAPRDDMYSSIPIRLRLAVFRCLVPYKGPIDSLPRWLECIPSRGNPGSFSCWDASSRELLVSSVIHTHYQARPAT